MLFLIYPIGFPGDSVVKNPSANAGDLDSIPGWGRSPEEEMTTHSSILAWEIQRTEEFCRLQSRKLKELDMTSTHPTPSIQLANSKVILYPVVTGGMRKMNKLLKWFWKGIWQCLSKLDINSMDMNLRKVQETVEDRES